MDKYWKINNAEGKSWIIPTKNAKVALQLYQPSGRNGKLLKALLPFFAPFTSIWSPFPITEEPVEQGLTDFLKKFFPNKDLTFSFFLGTPSAHKKSTIQIAENDNILAYCKTSNNKAVIELFNKEQQLLNWLANVGIKHIPACLYNDTVNGYDQQVFVMSTEKNSQSEVVHEWTSMHEQFLLDLTRKTTTECKFEDSDYHHLLVALNNRLDDLPDGVDKAKVESSINKILENYAGKTLNMVAMHGDFTPWNMFKQHDHLFVFDWEYALRSCPVNLDRYHFFSQQFYFEKHWSAEQVLDYMRSTEGTWMNIEEYMMYIVLILSVFVTREKSKCKSTDLFLYWNALLAGL